MLKFLFNRYEKEFLRHINKKHSIKLTKDNLNFAFHDLEGNGYYKFPKDVELPLSRTAKMQEYIMWLAKGVDKNEYLQALEECEKALEGGIKDGKGLARIGYILNHLKDRVNMVVHDELMYNIIAVQVIRGDESVTSFNNEIHMQKVESFKQLDRQDDTFFLNIQELLEGLGLSNITKNQYEKLLQESRATRQVMQRTLSSLLEK